MSQSPSKHSVPSLTKSASTHQSNASSTRSISTGTSWSRSGTGHSSDNPQQTAYSLDRYTSKVTQQERFHCSGNYNDEYYVRQADGQIARIDAAFSATRGSQDGPGNGGGSNAGGWDSKGLASVGALHDGKGYRGAGTGYSEAYYQKLAIDKGDVVRDP